MCGIAGKVYTNNQSPTTEEVVRLLDPIAHRGPDDHSAEIFGRAGLGQQRLSIIDLSPAGRNPMTAVAGRYTITFNGESYNYLENRKLLESKGYAFRSETDTEVLLNMYAEFGPAMMDRIDGMFAFAIWDAVEETLFVARDRMGQKPFYYAEVEGQFIFSSELKSLLADPAVSKEIDPQSVYSFLHLHYVPAPRTGYAQIKKLPAAHSLLLKNGVTIIERYWDYSYTPKMDITFDEAVTESAKRIRASVKSQLMSDVPLGAHLSGGLDSSIVVACMAELMSKPVKTFSIGFDDPALNELPFAEEVARTFATDHQSFMVSADVEAVLPELARLFDEPYADAAALPYYYLSRETRKHVTVALNGDGGDENYAGYRRYSTFQQLLNRTPLMSAAGMVAPLVSWAVNGKWEKRLKLLHEAVRSKDSVQLYRAVKQQMFPRDVDAMLQPEFLNTIERAEMTGLWQQWWDAAQSTAGEEIIDIVAGTDIRGYLADGLTKKVDMASMAHSIEVRSPFLDHHLIEWTAQLPAAYKIQGNETKVIEKAVGETMLPKAIFERRKQPFIVPLDRWFRTDLAEFVRTTLLADDAQINRFIQPHVISKMVSQHQSGKINVGTTLYAFVTLELWLQQNK